MLELVWVPTVTRMVSVPAVVQVARAAMKAQSVVEVDE
jgi:hypothetical protein